MPWRRLWLRDGPTGASPSPPLPPGATLVSCPTRTSSMTSRSLAFAGTGRRCKPSAGSWSSPKSARLWPSAVLVRSEFLDFILSVCHFARRPHLANSPSHPQVDAVTPAHYLLLTLLCPRLRQSL